MGIFRRTWFWELFVVILVLGSVWLYNTATLQEFVGTLAVIITFCYVQVATRLDEASVRTESHYVSCRAWLLRYFFLKETCWLTYFAIFLQAWSAAIGVVVFLIYPLWRKYHIKGRN